ncbi:hypothetical protein POL68_08775 [Stigmatella sp. ncwal1]|uniref:Phosphate-selective porin O and P n=1 Tax=Stigmatella ashevillensis TaxID=2995309 RepID=A0ABT5D4R2_9BACT|nr:hypothetical protein [Stigmatella ashevillena]MDC0708561.1 hypothetical protein [Stigmatella ashevillena]
MRRVGVLWGLLGVVLGSVAQAEVSTNIAGSLRSRSYLFSPLDSENYSSEFNVRPEFTVAFSEELSSVVTVNAQRVIGQAAKKSEGQLTVDRAFIDYRFEKWDLRIGRQAINMGSALIWNPIDLVDFNTALNFAVEKRGVDSARAAISLTPTSRVLGLVAFPDGKALSLLRGETLLGSTGLALLAADDRRRDEQIIGVDVKGDLWVGYWVEGAVHLPREGKASYRVVVGVDYSFTVLERLTLSAQYYRDSSGGTGVDDYDFTAYLEGRRPFLGRQYVSLMADLGLNEITFLKLSIIGNLEDRSGFVSLGVGRYFFDNLEVTVRGLLLGGVSGIGEYKPGSGHPLEGALSTRTLELYLDWRF